MARDRVCELNGENSRTDRYTKQEVIASATEGRGEGPHGRTGPAREGLQQKLDWLDGAFLFAQSIDRASYERQRDRLREELTLAQTGHHADATDELEVWAS